MDSVKNFSDSYDGKKLVPTKDLLSQNVRDCAVMLHLGRKQYFSFDEETSYMWSVLSEADSVIEGYNKLLSEYDVEENVLSEDLDSFISVLVREQIATLEPVA